MKDCKDDMHNLEIVNERAVDAETHLENENVRLNENDLYLRKQYMGLQKQYQASLITENDEKKRNQRLLNEVNQYKMYIDSFKKHTSTVEIDNESSSTVSATGVAAIAVSSVALGAAGFMIMKKNFDSKKTGLYLDLIHEEEK